MPNRVVNAEKQTALFTNVRSAGKLKIGKTATGTGVAHCPVSNMKLASGVCRVPDMLSLGVPLGLAVDGSASNDCSNLLAEIRAARAATAKNRLGLAAACIITTEFLTETKLTRAALGMPGLRPVVITHPVSSITAEEVAARVMRMVRTGRVLAVDGTDIEVSVESVCVHGDSPGATHIAAAVWEQLSSNGIALRAFC